MNNRLSSHLYSAFQGCALGLIVMAYICDYNTSQLPLALMCLGFSILTRFIK